VKPQSILITALPMRVGHKRKGLPLDEIYKEEVGRRKKGKI